MGGERCPSSHPQASCRTSVLIASWPPRLTFPGTSSHARMTPVDPVHAARASIRHSNQWLEPDSFLPSAAGRTFRSVACWALYAATGQHRRTKPPTVPSVGTLLLAVESQPHDVIVPSRSPFDHRTPRFIPNCCFILGCICFLNWQRHCDYNHEKQSRDGGHLSKTLWSKKKEETHDDATLPKAHTNKLGFQRGLE